METGRIEKYLEMASDAVVAYAPKVIYEESFPKIKSVIYEALRGVEGILQDPAPEVGIESFDTHNIVVAVRPFITPDVYWEGTFAVHEAVKSALSAAGIKMAYSEGVELGPIGE